MLPNEIEPFAEAHIDSLGVVRDLLQTLQLSPETLPTGITEEVLQDNINRLNQAKNAFVRFKVCMADEVKQKERLHQKNLHCRLHHQ